MGFSNKFKRVPLSSISVARSERQRSDLALDADGLSDSIRRFGVINPIIVKEGASPDTYELVAGERRFSTSAAVGLKDIPVRLVADLSDIELQIVELDENMRRVELHWRDHVKAVGTIHTLYQQLEGETWSYHQTAEQVGLNNSTVSLIMRVYSDLDSKAVANASGMREAYNILSRRDDRVTADAMNEILEINQEVAQLALPEAERSTASKGLPPEDSILQLDFKSWAESYSGPKFNFLHCDFPYGTNLFAGPQSGATRHETVYEDDPHLYWDLIKVLCANLDKIMAPSGHMVFWLSADFDIVARTVTLFNALAPSLDFLPMPLIWHKTDNVGILSDPQRRSRHIYEIALVASREDRKIIKAKSDTYGAPTNKEFHPSTKPEPVLRYFFEMFIDENTKMLDPTCGGGSALRAAESLGASLVLGLEADPAHCENARRALRSFRALRGAVK